MHAEYSGLIFQLLTLQYRTIIDLELSLFAPGAGFRIAGRARLAVLQFSV